MDITILQEYIKPELLVVAVVLYFIGMGIKKTEKISDKYIPIILGVIGVIFSGIYVIATSDFSGYQSIMIAIFTAVIQGILVAGLSVYASNKLKKTNKEEK